MQVVRWQTFWMRNLDVGPGTIRPGVHHPSRPGTVTAGQTLIMPVAARI